MTPDPLWKSGFGDDSQAVQDLRVATRTLGYEMFSDNVFEWIGPDGRCRPTEVITKMHPDHGPVRGSLLMSRPAGSSHRWRDLAFFPLNQSNHVAERSGTWEAVKRAFWQIAA